MMNAKLSRVLLLVISAGILSALGSLAAEPPAGEAGALSGIQERAKRLSERRNRGETVPEPEIREVESEFISSLNGTLENPKVLEALQDFYGDHWSLAPAPALLDLVERSPDPSRLALRFVDEGAGNPSVMRDVVLAALAARPSQVVLWIKAAGMMAKPVWRIALFEEAFQRWMSTADLSKQEDLAVAAALAGSLLQEQMRAGLTKRYLSTFQTLPPRVRERLTKGMASPVETRIGDLPFQGKIPDLRLDLATAFLVEGDAKAAGEWIRRVPEETVPQETPDTVFCDDMDLRQDVQRFRKVLLRSIEPSSGDPFDLLVESLTTGQCGELGRTLAVAQLAEREGYPAVKAFLYERARWAFKTGEEPFTPSRGATSRVLAAAGGLQAEREALRQTLEREGDAAREAARAGLGPDPAAALVPRFLRAPSRVRFTERPLPEGMTPVEVTSKKEKALRRSAKALKLPAGFAAVRAERQGDRAAAVGVSQSYDPVGEISSGAYWVLLSSDGGATWSQPLYTGLRVNQPYVVRQASALPFFEEDRLRIEVEIEEIDTAEIYFPPISLPTKRTAKGLFLEIPIADLERDTDGDGLTDLAEERLLTDPDNPDTDGDGFADAADSLPGVPWAHDPSPASRALAAFIAGISGVDQRAIVEGRPGPSVLCCRGDRPALKSEKTDFFVGDRALFAALDPDRRLVVLTPDEAVETTKKFGPFYPKELKIFLIDRSGRRGYAVWSASWQGGEMSLEEKNGQWVAEEISSWIT